MLRSYRSGDLPDVEITAEDVIKPLQELARRVKLKHMQCVFHVNALFECISGMHHFMLHPLHTFL